MNADGVTSGTLLHLDTSLAGFAGKYIDCYDGAASDFTVPAGSCLVGVITSVSGDVDRMIVKGKFTVD